MFGIKLTVITIVFIPKFETCKVKTSYYSEIVKNKILFIWIFIATRIISSKTTETRGLKTSMTLKKPQENRGSSK